VRLLVACSLGGAGHFQPLRPFLDAALERGDDVLVVGPPALAAMVGAAGYPFEAAGEPAEEQVRPIREQLAVAPAEEAARLGNLELFGRLATQAMLPGIDRIVSEWRPELILRDPTEYASATVGHERDIPVAQVAISLASVEAGSLTVATPAFDPRLVAAMRAEPYLTRFPASLDPSPFPATVRYRQPGTARGPDRLPPWWPAHPDLPLVYVTFGTVLGYMSTASIVYRSALDAVGGLDARVLLTVGHHFHEAGASLEPVPPNVRVEAWVDQSLVLRDASVVVCHGGSGTVLGSLAAGVPLVVWSRFADQHTNGRLVHDAGAGILVGEAAEIADAVRQVQSTPSYRLVAARLAAEMAAAPTAAEVLARLQPNAASSSA
jgi:UDP:flavonoid glycosyltransferase YjiC (YdhE family)